jgi:hypothetical protein
VVGAVDARGEGVAVVGELDRINPQLISCNKSMVKIFSCTTTQVS